MNIVHFRRSISRSAVLFALSVGGIALTLDIGVARAGQIATCNSVSSTGGNFTMLSSAQTPPVGVVGGTNDVSFTWDGSLFNSSTDYTGPGSVSNATLASTAPFFSVTWTAHDVQIFGPGTYTFDVTAGGDPSDTETGTLTMAVGPDQLGAHMLFDWGVNKNIDVAVVWNKNASFTGPMCTGGSNCGATPNTPNPDGNSSSTVFMLASTDPDGDGANGIPMAPKGPFPGFNANFSVKGTLGPANGTCAPTVDTTPDPFSFKAVTNAALNTQYESNTITVSGLGVSQAVPDPNQTAPISISTGGEYSLDGGITYTNAAGTVSNTDTVKVRATSGSANGITTSITLSIGSVGATFSISTPAIAAAQGSNFTMLDPGGGIAGGTNDVVATWDGACETSAASTNFSHMSLSSVTPFFQFNWTAHHIRVFCPGTYTINTACTTGNSSAQDLDAGTCTPNTDPTKNYTFTVGAGQIGAHILFNWNQTTNIDVVDIWNQNAVFGPSPMYTGAAACNNPTTVWDLMSADWDGDGQNGAAMIDGPFQGFKANFNIMLTGTPLACTAYTPTVNVADPSNAPGCSISSRPSNGIERGDWWLVAGFLAWLGGIRIRLKRKTQS